MTSSIENSLALNFDLLQKRFEENYYDIFLNDMAEKTVVIIPSLTLDTEILKTIKGVLHYEERLLCLLMLLRMPKTHIIYLTSVPIETSIIDYYLHLLPGITAYHAKQRLIILSCYDASNKSLTQKILERPRLINRIKEYIKQPRLTHMTCFNVTEYEQQLAVQLDIPIFGCAPSLLHLGTKSGCRKLFKELNVLLPDGFEDIHTKQAMINALVQLKTKYPNLKKAVVKMNDGFSGEGNAVFKYPEKIITAAELASELNNNLKEYLHIVASSLDYTTFIEKFQSMGGIVEVFIEAEVKESPSVQCRVSPKKHIDIISTHDQILSGDDNQVFMGASFPANHAYNYDIGFIGLKIANAMAEKGVIGRFGIDFISVMEETGWKHYAIETNLRKGGTTHPFIMIKFLTSGKFNWEKGEYTIPNGETRCYFASDNVYHEKYIGLTPHDLIDIAMCNNLLYDSAKQKGVMFHMIGALSQYGKLGMLCIGATVTEAKAYYQKTIDVLNAECGITTNSSIVTAFK